MLVVKLLPQRNNCKQVRFCVFKFLLILFCCPIGQQKRINKNLNTKLIFVGDRATNHASNGLFVGVTVAIAATAVTLLAMVIVVAVVRRVRTARNAPVGAAGLDELNSL